SEEKCRGNRTSCTPVFLKFDERFSGECDDCDLFVNENGCHPSVDISRNAGPHLLQTLGAKSLEQRGAKLLRIPTKFEVQGFFPKVDARGRIFHRPNGFRDTYHLVAQLLAGPIAPLARVLFHGRDRVIGIDVAISTLYEKALDTSTKSLFHEMIGNAGKIGGV